MHRLLTNRDLFARAKSLESPSRLLHAGNASRRIPAFPHSRILIYQFHERAVAVIGRRRYRADALCRPRLSHGTARRENDAIHLARNRSAAGFSAKFSGVSRRSSDEVSFPGGAVATNKSPSKRIEILPRNILSATWDLSRTTAR